jgi:CelD/BcsL family acetyltransferase involved in cellulose biosynthesis
MLSPAERARWSAFNLSGPTAGDPFLTHTYVEAVAGVRPGVKVAVIERSDGVAAFFAFQFPTALHSWLCQGEPAGGHMSDAFGLVGDPDLEISPAALLKLCGLHYFSFTHLPEAQHRFGLAGSTQEHGAPIDLTVGWPDYYDALRRSRPRFVRDTERRTRKLVEAFGPLQFCFARRDPQDHVHNIISCKVAQYRHTGARNAFASQWSRDLLFRLAQAGDPDCRGIVSTLHAGQTWVASHFGLISRNRLHYWFPVYNTELKSYAPGRLLLWAIVRSAMSRGLERIERGTGTQHWKRQFANASSSYDRGDWRLPGPRGALAWGSTAMAWRMRAMFH